MDAEYFRTMFAFNYWARDRLLKQISELSPEEYTATRPIDYGSIRATLVHNLNAEAGYLARWSGQPLETPINEETVPTAEALKNRWSEEQAKMTAFLAAMPEDGPNREVKQVSRSGQESINPLWGLMTQFINHGTTHRSEIASTITQLGHSPGDLDFIVYLREQR